MTGEPRRVTRRQFLTGAGIVATAAVAGGYGVSVWTRDAPTTKKQARTVAHGDPRGTLVVVELGGGNDALNMVVPNDPAYRALRPTLGVSDPIHLDDETGLHPKLVKLAERYRRGQVAIVEGVGYPDPNLSHFASLATWWSAHPGGSLDTGWLGRYLDATVGFDDPLALVAIGPTPSPAVLGERSFATSIADATGLTPRLPAWADRASDVVAAWRGFAPAPVDPVTLTERVDDALRLTVSARDELRATLGTGGAPAASDVGAAPGGALVDELELAGRLVAGRRRPRVVYVSGTGDFDTHQGEATRHPALMADLDTGIDRLFTAAGPAGKDLLVMTVSEFGRRPAENGSGTDHGTAAAHLLVGSSVRGGRHGARPSLARLDQHGNPVATVDFRALYASVLRDWLHADPEPVLDGAFGGLRVVA
ncbi:MAG TPA: DUF1501 domain-containing protein [Acidimicrobiia bacterium]|nr:DUF1501 domain-containing protein [Acidimicrobiia bacterium]